MSRAVPPKRTSPKAEFQDEWLAGVRLATSARIVAMALIAPLVVYLVPPGAYWFELALMVLIAASGLAYYLLIRKRPERLKWGYGFSVIDAIIIACALLYPNPLVDADWPPQMQLRNGVFIYLFIVVAVTGLTYSSSLTLWTGFCLAAAWGIGVWMLVLLPTSITAPEAGSIRSVEDYLQHVLSPGFIDVDVMFQSLVVLLVVTGIISIIVRRSRNLVLRHAATAREHANLARYFSPVTVEELANHDRPLERVREQSVAVLFTDIVGFTGMAEHMNSNQMIVLLRDYHRRLEDAVFEYGGTLDKFLGDGIMATFGTPLTGATDALYALKCVTRIRDNVAEWNRVRARTELPPITVSIGAHYGRVVLGNIGSERRLEFAVLGDVVNVASRLEENTRSVGSTALLSDALVRQAEKEAASIGQSDLPIFSELAEIPDQNLRGRDQAVPAWALPAPKDTV